MVVTTQRVGISWVHHIVFMGTGQISSIRTKAGFHANDRRRAIIDDAASKNCIPVILFSYFCDNAIDLCGCSVEAAGAAVMEAMD